MTAVEAKDLEVRYAYLRYQMALARARQARTRRQARS